MLNTIFRISVLATLLATLSCANEVDDVRTILEKALVDRENNDMSGVPELFQKMSEAVQIADEYRVKALLEIGSQCLRAPGLRAQALGLVLMFGVTLRASDGSRLLAPYEDVVAPFLDGTDEKTKLRAAWILGRTKSPKALVYLARHVADKSNSRDMAVIISWPLLESRDRTYVQMVLTLAEQRPEFKLKTAIITGLGLHQVATPEALKLIRDGLKDSTGEPRRITVEAIERLPIEVRKRFAAELFELTNVPGIDPQLKERAEKIIAQ